MNFLKGLDKKTAIFCFFVYVPLCLFATSCQSIDKNYVDANYEASVIFGDALIEYIEKSEVDVKNKSLQIKAIQAWQELNQFYKERTEENGKN